MRRLVPALLLVPAFASAGKPKLPLEPAAMSGAQAVGAAACTEASLRGPSSPFVVDWPDVQRADLESGLPKGVVVVKYACDAFQVLPGCTLPGGYSYTGISPKSNVVEMKDAASVQANFGSFVSPVKFNAAFEQGRALNLAYMMVGTQSTTVSQVKRAELQGACDGATHVVHRAYLGAFAMDSATAGSARAAVEVMTYGGASAGAESSKQAFQRDGDLKACEAATTADGSPRPGCAAMVRVTLLPIDGAAQGVAGTVDARGCPEGFVYAEGGCARPSEVTSWLCDAGDLVGCKQQCAAGSAESCGRYAGVLLDTSVEDVYVPTSRVDDLRKDLAPNRAAFQSACTEHGEADACTLAGFAEVIDEVELRPTTAAHWRASGRYFEAACAGGEAVACDIVNDLLSYGLLEDEGVPRDPAKANALIGQACEVGSGRACLMLAEMHAFDATFAEAFSAPERAHVAGRALADACHAGLLDACVIASAGYLAEARCQETVDWISKRVEEDSKLFLFEDDTSFCPLTVKLDDAAKSLELATFACGKGHELACGLQQRLAKAK